MIQEVELIDKKLRGTHTNNRLLSIIRTYNVSIKAIIDSNEESYPSIAIKKILMLSIFVP